MPADALSQVLVTREGRHSNSLSPERLELMGKEAANMYLSEGTSLNDSIIKLASEHSDMNIEQIKRVVESANTSVYLALHDKSKTASAESSYPQFTLADSLIIIAEMADKARPVAVASSDPDYGQAPEKKSKVSSAEALSAIAGMFGVKEASPEVNTNSADEMISKAKQMLTGLKENLENTNERLDIMHKEAQAKYYSLVRNHLLEDPTNNNFGGVMAAARSSGASNEKIACVMKPVVARLMQEKVASEHKLQEGVRQLEKVAHRVINDQHPLVTTFCGIVTLEDEMEKVASGLEVVDAELSKVNSFIKERLGAKASR